MKVVSPTRPLFMAGIFFPSKPTSQFPIAVDLDLAKTSIYIHVRRVTLYRLLPNMGNVGVWATNLFAVDREQSVSSRGLLWANQNPWIF